MDRRTKLTDEQMAEIQEAIRIYNLEYEHQRRALSDLIRTLPQGMTIFHIKPNEPILDGQPQLGWTYRSTGESLETSVGLIVTLPAPRDTEGIEAECDSKT